MGPDPHELTAAYALDALEPDEARAYEEHLAGCAQCREELASLQGAAGSLAYAVMPATPPESLRDRILDAARAERPNVVSLRRRPTETRILRVVAAIAACAVAGLAAWNVSLHHRLGHNHQALSGASLTGAKGSVVFAGSRGALVVSDLARAPLGKTYEAWVIVNGHAYEAGLFPGGTRTIVVRLTRALPAGSIVAVTLERAGGVSQPTQKPFITSAPV